MICLPQKLHLNYLRYYLISRHKLQYGYWFVPPVVVKISIDQPISLLDIVMNNLYPMQYTPSFFPVELDDKEEIQV